MWWRLRRDSLPDGVEHLVGEDVDLLERRVHVGRDADSPELGMHDRSVDDAVLVEQPRAQLHVVDPLDLKERNSACLSVVERSEYGHAGALLHQSLGPAVAEEAEPRDLA